MLRRHAPAVIALDLGFAAAAAFRFEVTGCHALLLLLAIEAAAFCYFVVLSVVALRRQSWNALCVAGLSLIAMAVLRTPGVGCYVAGQMKLTIHHADYLQAVRLARAGLPPAVLGTATVRVHHEPLSVEFVYPAFLSDHGIIWCESGRPPATGPAFGSWVTPLGGPWYWCSWP